MSSTLSSQNLLKNIFSLSIVQIANNVLPLITIPFLVRIIGPDRFGAINFMAAVVLYFTLFINYSFDLTATRRVAINRGNDREISKIFNEVLLAKFCLLLVSFFMFLVLLYSLPELSTEKPLAVYSFIYCISLVITPNWLFQGMQQLYQIALCNLVSKLLFVVFLLLCVRTKEDYILQPLIYSISTIGVGLVAFLFSIRKYNIKIVKVNLRNVFKLLWVEKTVFASLILINLYTTANLIILGLQYNNHAVALYSASWKLITVIQTLISMPLSLSLFPYIGASFAEGRSNGLQKIKNVIPFIMTLTLVTGIVLWLICPWVISIFYGPEFSESVKAFRILCFIPFLSSLSNMLGIQTMINLKMDKLFFRLTLAGALVGITASFYLTASFGFIGAAWAWLATELFTVIILWAFLYFRQIQVIDPSLFTFKHLRQLYIPLISVVRSKLLNKS